MAKSIEEIFKSTNKQNANKSSIGDIFSTPSQAPQSPTINQTNVPKQIPMPEKKKAPTGNIFDILGRTVTENPYTPQLQANATKSILKGIPKGTVNELQRVALNTTPIPEVRLGNVDSATESIKLLQQGLSGVKPVFEPKDAGEKIGMFVGEQLPYVIPVGKGLQAGSSVISKALPKLEKTTLEKTVQQGIKLPEIKPVTNKNLPKIESKTQQKKRLSFPNTVSEAEITDPKLAKQINKTAMDYTPITNKETLEKAKDAIRTNREEAFRLVMSNEAPTAESNAIAELFIKEANDSGNFDTAISIVEHIAEQAKTQGQAIQALSMIGRFTPDGVLRYANKVVSKSGKKLQTDEAKQLYETAKKLQGLQDGSREKEIELARLLQQIADLEPVTAGEKIKGAQRIAMLLNPKTMVRNTLGNAIFGTADNVANTLGAGIDKLVSLKTGQRTTGLPSITGQLKSAARGVKETLEDAKLGVDTYSLKAQTQYELPSKRIYKNPVGNALDKATRAGLQLGDRPFYNAAYDDVLRQQMKLANVTEPTKAMKEQAQEIALQRTYQDVNKLTESFRKAQNALNEAGSYLRIGNKDFGLGNIVMPFVKTPANLLARAIDYSPLGITKAIKEAVNAGKGTFNQKVFVDSISRSVTGTALIMVGYDLAKKGIITGGANKNANVAAFEKQLGKSEYAFNIDGNYFTYDWAQPASLLLAIGADIYNEGKNRKEAENVVIDAIKSGGQTLFNQSLLQGLQKMFGGYSIMDNLETTAYGVPAQFIPTFSKQIAQQIDPTARSTYDPDKLTKTVNQMKAKLPGTYSTLEPRLNSWGQEQQTYQNNNPFNIFLNPGFSTKYQPSNTEKELLRLYEQTGETGVIPKVAPKTFQYKGETITLTAKEITQFQRIMGDYAKSRLQNISKMGGTDQSKAKKAKAVIEDSYDKAKADLLKNRGIK